MRCMPCAAENVANQHTCKSDRALRVGGSGMAHVSAHAESG